MTKRQLRPILISAALIILASCTREVMHEQADASAPLTNAAPIDLDAAIAQARAGNKLVLLDFTGSDWCPPCMELHDRIFSQPEFRSYAASNLVFLTVDFPQKYRLSPDAGKTNDLLATKFDVEGFPTLVALDGNGKELWRHLGYVDGGFKELRNDLAAAGGKAE